MKLSNVRNHDQIFLENLVRNIPQYVFWKDANSVYLGCNDNYARMVGLKSPGEIVGKTDFDIGWLPDGDSAELFRQGDQETIQGNYVTNQEEWLSLPNGIKILVLVNKSPILDEENKVLGVLGIATDITEKKRTEQDLQETRHKLQGMTLVGASIAHELRTPLSTISVGTSNLKKYFPALLHAYQLAVESDRATLKIKPSSLKLLNELPALMENETNAAFTFIDMMLMSIAPSLEETQSELFSIASCVDEALARYPFKSDQKKLIHWNNTADFIVKGKQLLVVHILFNLWKNALYYIAKARKGMIEIWLTQSDDCNFLYFKDTGTGIPAAEVPYIFDRFFTKTLHGAGIGLTFCKTVMESFGGAITCESVEGDYTQFALRFPIVQLQEEIDYAR